MEQVLQNLITALRSSGVRISISESMDAIVAIRLTGYADRTVFKNSLSMTLAKSQHEKEIFNACFDRFFSLDFFSENPAESSAPSDTDSTDTDNPLTKLLLDRNNAELSVLMSEAAKNVNINRISFFTQKGLYLRRILLNMGLEGLDSDIKKRRIKSNFSNKNEVKKLKQARVFLFDNVRNYVEKQLSLFSGAATEKIIDNYLKDVKLSNLEKRDYDRMHFLIQKMTRQLNDLHSRRKKISTRGRIDVKKTLRANIAYQGILIDPRWKTKKIDRPNLAVLCDVSRSVETVVRFMLLFLYGLNNSLVKIRSYIFCSNLIEVGHIFKEYKVGEALARIQKGTGLDILYSGTDYGHAFRDFAHTYMNNITNKTTVLILGDARNNYGNPETGILKSIKEKSKRIIWLNPEPPSFWGTGDSEMQRYRPYCFSVKECSTLRHLQRIIDYLLKPD